MAAPDPFNLVREEVQQSLSSVDSLFSRWIELRNSCAQTSSDSTVASDFDWTSGELERILKTVRLDLEDLEETIRIVESNRSKFSFDDEEINARNRFISTTAEKVRKIESEMKKPAVQQVDGVEARAHLLEQKSERPRSMSKFDKAKADYERDNDQYIKDQFKDQQVMMNRQDNELDVMSGHVQTLGRMASEVYTELDRQNAMLDDLDAEVDNTEGRLKEAMVKLKEVIAKSQDKGKICTILILVAILIFLLFMLF